VVTVEVVIVGGGPVGLMLAGELCLAGVHPVVLERQPEPRQTPKANGLGGQIVQLLDYRGLLEPFSADSPFAGPAPAFQFGSVPLDFTRLDTSPLHILLIGQPRLEHLLEERARPLGADIRHGHELRTLSQDDDGVTLEIHTPKGDHRLHTRYLVGCDGAGSLVRAQAGIAFPGTTDTAVTRLGHVRMAEGVRWLDSGELEVPGTGRIPGGFNPTERGVFTMASFTPGVLLVAATEEPPTPVDLDAPMTLEELAASIHRVLGTHVPLGEPIWLSRTVAQARLAERYRAGRVLLAGDAAHLFPAGGAALNAGLTDAANLAWKLAAELHGWAPAGLLESYHDERHAAGERTLLHARAQAALGAPGPDAAALRALLGELVAYQQPLRHLGELLAGADIRYATHLDDDAHPLAGRWMPDLPLATDHGPPRVAELLHRARPVLLDLTAAASLNPTAAAWADRVEVVAARCQQQPTPADVVLIRPDGYVAWATSAADADADGLHDALAGWFGLPGKPET
jgi:2-polyprenyl-6-methoxyphenol hydroxylase-like FAD-dependent oxidoreductase